MDIGSAADWTSAGVNGVLALVAVYSVIRSHKATARADEERDRAELTLEEERRREARRRLTQFHLDAVLELADQHGALEAPNIHLRPVDRGRVTAGLAALPINHLPLYRGWFLGDPRAVEGAEAHVGKSQVQRWLLVRDELAEELRRLGAGLAT